MAPSNARSSPEGSGTPTPAAGTSVEENAAARLPDSDDEFSSANSKFSRLCKLAISLAKSDVSESVVRSALAGLGTLEDEPTNVEGVSSSGLAVELESVASSCSRSAIRFWIFWISRAVPETGAAPVESATLDVAALACFVGIPEPEGRIVTVAPAPIVSVFCRIWVAVRLRRRRRPCRRCKWSGALA